MVIDWDSAAWELAMDKGDRTRLLYQMLRSKLATVRDYAFGQRQEKQPPKALFVQEISDDSDDEPPPKRRRVEARTETAASRSRQTQVQTTEWETPVPSIKKPRSTINQGYYPEMIREELDFVLFLLSGNENAIKLDWPRLESNIGKTQKAM